MNQLKKSLSVLGTLGLSILGATCVATLFDSAFILQMPTVTWLALSLTLGMLAVSVAQKLLGRLTPKALLGIAACTLLVLSLCFGLFTAINYLTSYAQDGFVVTSFPWYWGFGFAQYLVGPVAVVLGILWLILHVRQDRRNIRDVLLILRLVFAAVAVWAVLDTVADVRATLLYNDTRFPWHFQLVMDVLKYGAMLLTLWGIHFGLKYWQNHSVSKERAEIPPQKTPRAPAPWHWTAADAAITFLPAALMILAGSLLWQTDYRWYNLGTVVGNSLCICLFIALGGWTVAHHYRCSKKLGLLRILTWIFAALTVAAGVLWTMHFNREELYPLTGLPDTLGVHFGILYFGPLTLGALQGSLLLGRLEKRLAPAEEGPSLPWALTAAALAVALVLGSWGLLNITSLNHEVPLTLTAITEEDESHVEFYVRKDVYVSGGAYAENYAEGNRYYIREGGSWWPFGGVSYHYHYHNISAHDGEITQVYVQKAPGIYVLAAEKDPETGKWHLTDH
jgi:hypothetical protein